MSAGNIDQPNLKIIYDNTEVYMAWMTKGVDNFKGIFSSQNNFIFRFETPGLFFGWPRWGSA